MYQGYFSLAQANFNSSSRTRYGQDYYDERMQALRRVYVEPVVRRAWHILDADCYFLKELSRQTIPMPPS